MSDLLKAIEDCTEDSMKDRFLTFLTGDWIFGVEIQDVIEIIVIQSIVSMPEMPDYIRGLINLRGKIVPVLDTRIRFHMPPKEYDDQTCIIVLDAGEMMMGLIVDRVSDVLTIPTEDVIKTPEVGRGGSSRYVKSIGKADDQVILLLDYRKLMGEEDLPLIQQSPETV